VQRGFEQKIRHWLALIALEALRTGQTRPETRRLSTLQRARVTEFVRQNLAARPSLEVMADAAHLSLITSRVCFATLMG
jgi:hypothetical protein